MTTRPASKDGKRLEKAKSLLELLAGLEPLDEEFPIIDDPPPEPIEIFPPSRSRKAKVVARQRKRR